MKFEAQIHARKKNRKPVKKWFKNEIKFSVNYMWKNKRKNNNLDQHNRASQIYKLGIEIEIKKIKKKSLGRISNKSSIKL